MKKSELKTLKNVYDSIDELLKNIYDAEEHVNPETGELLSDVSNAEKALVKLNNLIRAIHE